MEDLEWIISIKKQFEYYKALGDKAIDQVSNTALFIRPDLFSNSIAIIVHHLSGNMKSRWTDFLTSDGEKPWRNRDMEFKDVLKTKEEVLHHWNTGWLCLFEAIASITQTTIHTPVYIRNAAHTIPEALNRQLTHYAYHIGQIVYLSKRSQGNAWQSLSIPKNASASYNKTKFAEPRHTGHYIDDLLG
ncbi:DUF1572 family protein [Aquimarina sp. 2-A2]|uniref:DUF1572 family protein n=1 Tax=Aquimarina sp. 2-A2 TaxID=3382644 RepID=UPI00387EFBF1